MDAAKAELKRALGQVVRGLATLFWILPAMIIIDVETARTDWLGFLDGAAILPGLAAGVVLYGGFHWLRDFQKQERIWQRALTRAEALAVVNAGLAPFLYWWHRFPSNPFYTTWVTVFAFGVLLLFMQVNQVLRRLCAMLPDENLRAEIKMFTSLNAGLFLAVLVGLASCLMVAHAHLLPRAIEGIVSGDNPRGLWLVLFVNLMPVAMTLAILWRIKEVIFLSILAAE